MTETSRRALLRAGASAAVLAPLAGMAGLAGTAAAAVTTRDLYTRSRFAPLVGKRFTLVSKTGTWRVTLREVGDLPDAAGGERKRFGLTFRAPGGGPTQGTYFLRRTGFTSTLLFVVPSDAGRQTYQAVIDSAP